MSLFTITEIAAFTSEALSRQEMPQDKTKQKMLIDTLIQYKSESKLPVKLWNPFAKPFFYELEAISMFDVDELPEDVKADLHTRGYWFGLEDLMYGTIVDMA